MDPAAYVDDRLAEGSDFLKIFIEDSEHAFGPEVAVPTLSAAQIRGLVAACDRRRVVSVVHISEQKYARMALEAGASGLAHVFHDTPAQDDVARTAVRTGAFITATLCVMNSFESDHDPAATAVATDRRVAPYLSAQQREHLATDPGWDYPGLLEAAMRNLRVFHQAGVPILMGTDATVPGLAHGVSALVELELLVRAGLLLVNGDPTDDITAMRDIAAVWKNGAPIDRRP